jgi:hypothetical protein
MRKNESCAKEPKTFLDPKLIEESIAGIGLLNFLGNR